MVTWNSALLSKIITGKTRGAILALLFGRPDESFYLRQVVRASGRGLGPVQRELKLLTEAGLIRRTRSGRQVYFQANPESPVFPELKSLIAKTVGVGDALRRALAPMKPLIRVALIYGSAARGEEKPGSDIDLLIVGDVSFSDLVLHLQVPQNALGREINPTVYSIAEFQSRLRERHHFVTSVIDEKKIFVFGDEDELRRLAPKRLARRA